MVADYTQHALVPYFRWAGFNSTANLAEPGSQSGISGSLGRFLGVWYVQWLSSQTNILAGLMQSILGHRLSWQLSPAWVAIWSL